jgi:xanthine phosphoribosyltransferase
MPPLLATAFVVQPPSTAIKTSSTLLFVKKTKKQQARQDLEDLNKWYDNVKSDATPDDVFWEETDRQRLLNQIGSEETDFVVAASAAVASTATSFEGFQNNMKPNPTLEMQVEAQKAERSTENTLLEYATFAVDDNWISDQLVAMFGSDNYEDGLEGTMEDREEQDRMIEAELQQTLEEGGDDDDELSTASKLEAKIKGFNDAWMTDAEPWDIYGQPRETANAAIRVIRDDTNEFLLSPDDDAEDQQLEHNFLDRMQDCQIYSSRLEKARNNPKAKAFFDRAPDAIEGFDRMWVCAIDSACYSNLAGVFRNYGVQFADNFADFEDGCTEDGLYSIEDVASYKARKIFEVTGLPVVTMRTGFEVEPIPPTQPGVPARATTPLISSGYRFNDIGDHVDHMIEALKPVSEPKRVTRYRTCLCYYDGEMELYEFSTLDCDIYWATSLRTFIPVNQAINQICKTLQLTFGLEYMKWLKTTQLEASTRFGGAVTQLRDRVLKDGRVLPNDIIDVSAFMDSMVDVNLMDDCAKELSERFMDLKPTKILTVATTGLVIALPMAKYLQVPVVYARKERNVVMADTYKASFNSNTVGKNRELLVSKAHLNEEDRVLIVDDFLSSGASQDALLRIVADSGAESVGVGVLLEKVYDSGRRFLSGFDVPVESLCSVVSVQGGVIQLLEEDGFELM